MERSPYAIDPVALDDPDAGIAEKLDWEVLTIHLRPLLPGISRQRSFAA